MGSGLFQLGGFLAGVEKGFEKNDERERKKAAFELKLAQYALDEQVKKYGLKSNKAKDARAADKFDYNKSRRPIEDKMKKEKHDVSIASTRAGTNLNTGRSRLIPGQLSRQEIDADNAISANTRADQKANRETTEFDNKLERLSVTNKQKDDLSEANIGSKKASTSLNQAKTKATMDKINKAKMHTILLLAEQGRADLLPDAINRMTADALQKPDGTVPDFPKTVTAVIKNGRATLTLDNGKQIQQNIPELRRKLFDVGKKGKGKGEGAKQQLIRWMQNKNPTWSVSRIMQELSGKDRSAIRLKYAEFIMENRKRGKDGYKIKMDQDTALRLADKAMTRRSEDPTVPNHKAAKKKPIKDNSGLQEIINRNSDYNNSLPKKSRLSARGVRKESLKEFKAIQKGEKTLKKNKKYKNKAAVVKAYKAGGFGDVGSEEAKRAALAAKKVAPE